MGDDMEEDNKTDIVLDTDAVASLLELLVPICLIITITLIGLLGYGWYSGTKLLGRIEGLEKEMRRLQEHVDKQIEQKPVILFSDSLGATDLTDTASMPIIVLPQPKNIKKVK